ncbi:MAG: serine aminopeptidase domain-containing protein [Promethearchaeota archaeon]
MEDIIIENLDIPVDSGKIQLKASIYYTNDTPNKSPFMIVATGLLGDRKSFFPKFFINKFTKAGLYVLCYDHRAHGETAIQTGKNWIKLLPKTFEDIHEVISYILEKQSERLLDDQIFLFGRSYAGAMLLTQGFSDKRAKKIIALATRYDYRTIKQRFPENCIDFMSCKNYLKYDPEENNKRIFLAHCKDDKEIEFFNILKIKEHLGLDDENILIFETGGHSFRDHRDQVAEKAIEFLQRI